MSQDKPVATCVCPEPSAQGVHHRSDGPCFVEPVAAQEPIAWFEKMEYGNYPVLRWKQGYVAKIGDKFYYHAAPCARCTEKEQLIAEQNRLAKERQEWALHTNEIIHELERQCEDNTDLRARCDKAEKYAERTRLTDDQKDRFVAEFIGYGVEFVTPIYALVEAIEKAVLAAIAKERT